MLLWWVVYDQVTDKRTIERYRTGTDRTRGVYVMAVACLVSTRCRVYVHGGAMFYVLLPQRMKRLSINFFYGMR